MSTVQKEIKRTQRAVYVVKLTRFIIDETNVQLEMKRKQ